MEGGKNPTPKQQKTHNTKPAQGKSNNNMLSTLPDLMNLSVWFDETIRQTQTLDVKS